MEKAHATFRNRHVEFDQTLQWPEGMRLEIAPTTDKLSLDEAKSPKTAAEKAAWLEYLRTPKPFDMN